MIRILVTGSNGQLGKCFQKSASQYTELEFVFRNSKALDITNTENIESIFELKNCDYCINCAAYTNVEQSEKTPEKAFKVNAEGARNLAKFCKEHNIILVHISTDYVFDGEKKSPYTVDDIPSPINEYGKSKLLGEQYIQRLLQKYYIVRSSWLYSEFGSNFYKTILKKAEMEEVIYVTDEQTGCPTNANNLSKYILEEMILRNKDYGIYHFTDGEAMTWFDFALVIQKENNLEGKVQIVRGKNYRTFAKRPKSSILN